MSFNNTPRTSRLDDLRSRNPQSAATTTIDNPPTYTNPSRYSASFMSLQSQPANDVRSSLQRRFTADSSKTPTPIGQQPSHALDKADFSLTNIHKAQALEKKRLEYEMIREQRKKFEAELELFNQLQAKEKQEIDQLEQEVNQVSLNAGHQSEPTTPPEYRDHVFPSVFSRTNRYSTSSIMSPPGFNNRSSRSGSQITSPPTEIAQTLHNHINSDTLPSKSVPGSRRGSNDRFTSFISEMAGSSQRPFASKNRYSMPVPGTKVRHSDIKSDFSSNMGLGHINTTSFLFGDDDEKTTGKKESTTSPDVNSYLQMNATNDKFPILLRHDEFPGVLSASSAALDLALSQSPGPESQGNGWSPFTSRHRHSQQSLPQNILTSQANGQVSNGPVSAGSQQSPETTVNPRQLNRHSMEASLASYDQTTLSSQATSGESGRPTLASVPLSYSANDVPTMKNVNGLGGGSTPTKSQAQQQLHNHNASLGRIPPHAVNHRHSRELSGGETRREDQINGYQNLSSVLQPGVTSLGPTSPPASSVESTPHPLQQVNGGPYVGQAFYGGYGMQFMNVAMAPASMGNPITFSNNSSAFQPQNPVMPYQVFGQAPRFTDSQARVIQQRRLQNGEDNTRFINVKLEHLQGEIYALCKDQHGCRYLQKKLEERNPEYVRLIFLETNQHVVELMTDPFGNYLCQKLLEFSNDDQRTVLIANAAPQMVKIALNQHGTRALQKMIEFISTPEQTQTIIHALRDRVVELIKDLNGNHVIQKCLNRLTSDDAQFIFDGVGNNCVVVGTHRHGCCVLQRCIDHASGHQKAQLIGQITANAFSLVQDPFGNYVLQYIVDLAEPAFTDPLCYSFAGSIPALSKQKFSSNVIEKCIRGAQPVVTKMMIEEILNTDELDKMLSDSFANYVVQTALEYADPDTKNKLIDAIRPMLPAIRQTPHGRRIQNKILGGESHGRGRLSGPATPHDATTPGQIPLARPMQKVPSSNSYSVSAANGFQGTATSFLPPIQTTYPIGNSVKNSTFYDPSSATSSVGIPSSFGNGSSGNTQISSENGQIHQPTPVYARTSTVPGFNYF